MFKIVQPGVMNTIQDGGRHGYQMYGVPVSGAMDVFSLRTGNQLVGNFPDEAAFEIHSNIALQTDSPHLLSVTGAEASIKVNGLLLPMWFSLFVRASSLIEIEPLKLAWTYLAVHGGIDVPRVLGSKSTYLRAAMGGLKGRALFAGDQLGTGPVQVTGLASMAGRQAGEQMIAWAKRRPPARVILGPHRDYFSHRAISALLSTSYVVTEPSDRMGYRLRGAPIERSRNDELLSCGVPLGGIQVPPDGQPIVLMADHQTTGGYPIIATIVSEDFPLIAQCVMGETITFADIETSP